MGARKSKPDHTSSTTKSSSASSSGRVQKSQSENKKSRSHLNTTSNIKNGGTKSERTGSETLNTALLLKKKLLEQQKNSPQFSRIIPKPKPKPQSPTVLSNVTSKPGIQKQKKKPSKRTYEPEPESESEFESDNDSDDDEDQNDNNETKEKEKELSVMELMKLQFEKQFGKVKGISTPVQSDNTNENESSNENEKKTKKTQKSTKKKTNKNPNAIDDGDDEWDIEIPQHDHVFHSMLSDIPSKYHNEEDEEEEDDDDEEQYSDFDEEDYEINGKLQDFQSSDEDDKPLVVSYTEPNQPLPKLGTTRREKRLFMSAKAPADISKRLSPEELKKLERRRKRREAGEDEEDSDDEDEEEQEKLMTQEDLKNDIELQRLLKESHILAEAREQGRLSGYDISTEYDVETRGRRGGAPGGNGSGSGSGKSNGLFGDARLKAMDLRMNELGMKKRKNMNRKPTNMKILQEKAQERKVDRRRRIDEAREAGIILPKNILNGTDPKYSSSSSSSSKSRKRADKGLQFDSVGKDTKFGRIISKRDIAKVSGKK